MSGGPSYQLSMLILAKCSCDTAVESYEKSLSAKYQKRMLNSERELAALLQQELVAAHQLLGQLLVSKAAARFNKKTSATPEKKKK